MSSKLPLFKLLLHDKSGYVSRKLGLVYWCLHVVTCLFFLPPIVHVFIPTVFIAPLITESSYLTFMASTLALYLGANVVDSKKETAVTLDKKEEYKEDE